MIRQFHPSRDRALPVLITAPHGGGQDFGLPERSVTEEDTYGRQKQLTHKNGRPLSKRADSGTIPLAAAIQKSITLHMDGAGEPFSVRIFKIK